jgi:hypothetical protein
MPNGRCRMHGGTSPKGNKNALKHGLYTAEAFARRREMSGVMRALRAFARIEAVLQQFALHGVDFLISADPAT